MEKNKKGYLFYLLVLLLSFFVFYQATPVLAEESVPTSAQESPTSDTSIAPGETPPTTDSTDSAADGATVVDETPADEPKADTPDTATSIDSAQTASDSSSDVTSLEDATVTPSETTEAAVAEPVQASTEEVAKVDTKNVTILHTNDIHGRLEGSSSVIGIAKVATIVEEARAENPVTLVLDAGDAFQGMPISNNSKGAAMAAMMNQVGYDAMTVGNHEFDFGFEEAIGYKDLLNFPIVSSNIYKDGKRVYDPYTIITKDGIGFAVIGATTPETATKTHPNNVKGVTFTDPITETEKVVQELTASHPTIKNYIFLVHLGIDPTTKTEWQGGELARALSINSLLADKQTVVIDGHSHTTVPNGEKYGNVQYVQTGSYLGNIGKVTYTVGENNFNAQLISAAQTADVAEDDKVAALVKEAKDEFAFQNSQVIVEMNPVELNGERSDVRVRETNLGDLVTDAMYNYGQHGFANKTDLAVTNGGGLRASIAKDAPITKGDVINVLPFGNIISQIDVSGQQILDMFAFSLRSAIQVDEAGNPIVDSEGLPLLGSNGGFLQASGVKVFFNPLVSGLKEDGTVDPARILKIQIYNQATETYENLDLTRTYFLATNDFLAVGGDGYDMLYGPREEGPSLDEVFASYLTDIDLLDYANPTPYSRILPLDPALDNDGDGFTNEQELAAGTDPFDPASKPTIADPDKPTKDEPTKQEPTKKEPTEKETAGTKVTTTTSKKAAATILPNTGSDSNLIYLVMGTSFAFAGFVVVGKKSKKAA